MSSSSRRHRDEWRAHAAAARTTSNAILASAGVQPGPSGEVDFSLVRFAQINAAALEQFSDWESGFGFPWRDTPNHMQNDARHLDLSLWYGDTLCGLCFASPSGARTLVRIKLLEGKPSEPGGPHALATRVIELCTFAVAQYCKIIGAVEIVIDSPLEDAVPKYIKAGYQMVNGDLVMAVEP